MLSYPIKRFIAQFLMPVPLVIELFLLGWFVQRLTRFKRLGMGIKILSGVLFLTAGSGLGGFYLHDLERRCPPFDPGAEQVEGLRGADIVVLASGYAVQSDLPLRYRANASQQLRLLEGIRIAKQIPDSRLLVSVAGEGTDDDKRAFLNAFVRMHDFPTDRLVMFAGAHDTRDEARLSLERARGPTLIVATSASHIPRAVRIFQKQGASPIPAPCDYQTAEQTRIWRWRALPLPSPSGFTITQTSLYEFLGLIYEGGDLL